MPCLLTKPFEQPSSLLVLQEMVIRVDKIFGGRSKEKRKMKVGVCLCLLRVQGSSSSSWAQRSGVQPVRAVPCSVRPCPITPMPPSSLPPMRRSARHGR